MPTVAEVGDVPYLYLLFAIIAEVAGSLLLRASYGFERLGTGAAAVFLFIVSLGLLSFAMRTIPISVSYPLGAGLGTVGALLGGRFLFSESISALQLAGVAVVLVGALMVRLSQAGS